MFDSCAKDYFSLQLWFYEYFPGLAPRRRRGAVHDFPVGASWRDRGESRVESVSALRGLLRRGTSSVGVRITFVVCYFLSLRYFRCFIATFYGFQVATDVQYRPWAGMTNLPEALQLLRIVLFLVVLDALFGILGSVLFISTLMIALWFPCLRRSRCWIHACLRS